MKNKYFVFSDTHGEYTKLINGLKRANFDIQNPNHILISCGDLFDRGNENVKLFKFLYEMQEKGRFKGILGNHDELLLRIFNKKMSYGSLLFHLRNNGLDKTIQEFGNIRLIDFYLTDITEQDVRIGMKLKFPNLPKFINSLIEGELQIGNHIFTHAGKRLNSQNKWVTDSWGETPFYIKHFPETEEYQKDYADKIIVFGHWYTKYLNRDFLDTDSFGIFKYKNFIGLDSFACHPDSNNYLNIYTFEGEK